jgi:peptidoglycan/xylan/chitin deacetylase (PgdA/CDA1 family)
MPAVILTYHQIVPDGACGRSFYALSRSGFERQVDVIARRTCGLIDGMIDLDGGHRVCLSFDDGTADHRWAADTLRSRGLVGTFFVITGRLGQDGWLSEADVSMMALQGHRIASHSVTHARLPTLGPGQLAFELTVSKEHLERLTGRVVDWLATPGGYCDDHCVEVAATVGYSVIRTMEWGYPSIPLRGRVPCLPVLPHYDLTMFQRLIEGNAPIWLHRTKQHFKRALGEPLYVRLRDLGGRMLGAA